MIKAQHLIPAVLALLLSGCFPENDNGTQVTMRDFNEVQVGNALANRIHTAGLSRSTDDGATLSNTVAASLTSSVYCEDTTDADCQCSFENTDLTQIFMKTSLEANDLTRLYTDEAGVIQAEHEFTGTDVIGIDMTFDANNTGNFEYVRMSDIYVFDQDGGDLAFNADLGIDVFKDDEAGTHSVSYDFPIGSSEQEPSISTTGCWMRIVLDFE